MVAADGINNISTDGCWQVAYDEFPQIQGVIFYTIDCCINKSPPFGRKCNIGSTVKCLYRFIVLFQNNKIC